MMKYILIALACCALSTSFGAAVGDNPSLEGTSWKLVRIQSMNNSEIIPANPSDYLLRFRGEGRLVIESDCNTAGATWVQDKDSLQLLDLVTTNKLCQNGSLHNRLISGLLSVNSYTWQDDKLVLLTSMQGVQLEFELI